MNLLLHTHILLWWLGDAASLGDRARGAIADARNGVWVSAASGWEVAIKSALGRLHLPGPAAEVLPAALAENDFALVDIRRSRAPRERSPEHSHRSVRPHSHRPGHRRVADDRHRRPHLRPLSGPGTSRLTPRNHGSFPRQYGLATTTINGWRRLSANIATQIGGSSIPRTPAPA